MKTTITSYLSLTLLCISLTFPGCKSSPERIKFNSLAAVGQAVDLAEREYLDRIISKQIKTNGFPELQQDYQTFQFAYSFAVIAAGMDSNSVPSTELSASASKLIQAIQQTIKQYKK